MVDTNNTLSNPSVCLILALAAILGLHVWSYGIHQEYLKAAEPLGRFIQPKGPGPKFVLGNDECAKILRPAYELCNTDDLWRTT